jgi:hypothetical protein
MGAIALAQEIRRRVPVNQTLDHVGLLTMTRARTTQTVGLNVVRAIPESERSAVKALVDLRAQVHTDQKRWRFDDRLRVLIVPGGQDEALREALLSMKRNNAERICLFECEDHNDIVPQSVHVFAKDGTFQLVSLCRPCAVDVFRKQSRRSSILPRGL